MKTELKPKGTVIQAELGHLRDTVIWAEVWRYHKRLKTIRLKTKGENIMLACLTGILTLFLIVPSKVTKCKK